jgi:hypothetical protein
VRIDPIKPDRSDKTIYDLIDLVKNYYNFKKLKKYYFNYLKKSQDKVFERNLHTGINPTRFNNLVLYFVLKHP